MKKFIIIFSLIVVILVGCTSKNTIDDKIIVVGASTSPHAQILEICHPYIEEAGYQLKIVEYTDYVLPNLSLQDGSLDANFFQHQP